MLMASPMSHSFSFHYCGGHLVSVANVFETSKGCGMESEVPETHHQGPVFQTDCCQDVVLVPQIDDGFSFELITTTEFDSSNILTNQPTFAWDIVPLSKDAIGIGNLPRPPTLIFKRYKRFQQLLTYG